MNAFLETPKPLKGGTAVHGYAVDEIKHVFQTSIRTGDEKRAIQCAVELEESGMADWIWNRLPVIASEDVGLARLELHAEIEGLRRGWKKRRNDKMHRSCRGINHFFGVAARLENKAPIEDQYEEPARQARPDDSS